MRVHVVRTGRLIGNETVLRGEGWGSVLRRRKDIEFPVYSYVVEHPDGHLVIDTGLNSRGYRLPWPARRVLPSIIEIDGEIGPQMRAKGLRPEDVRWVVPTHLDPDHAGGMGNFPDMKVLIHRPEYEFASTSMGKLRFQTRMLWPAGFTPTLYDLDLDPYGPFPRNKQLSDNGDVRIIPLPGHSVGQVGVVVEANGHLLLFGGDHVLRQDWFVEDYRAGHLYGLGALTLPKRAAETTRRIHQLTEERTTILLPAHDSQAAVRLAAREPLVF